MKLDSDEKFCWTGACKKKGVIKQILQESVSTRKKGNTACETHQIKLHEQADKPNKLRNAGI